VIVLLVAVAVFAPMLAEAAISRRHERALHAAGATEASGDVYRAMRIAYPGAFLLMIAEGLWRDAGVGVAWWAGAALFLAAKGLKYWAIRTLGLRWTFRVLVPPRATRIASGPYRWLRHPNYIAVAGELVGAALMVGALVTGPLTTLGFTGLMLARVRIEDRALELERR
jgi:methyltransferase